MGSRASWVQAVYDFLEERGGEAPLRQVAEVAAARVPPGPAWRVGNAKRKTDARYRNSSDEPPAELPTINDLSVIRTGQKKIVLRDIYYERRAGRLERYERDGRAWLRVLDAKQ
jgi:hypothetical protein